MCLVGKKQRGKGLDALVDNNRVLIGSGSFIGLPKEKIANDKSAVYVRINDKVSAFRLRTNFRDSIPQMIPVLNNKYPLSLLSGDNDNEMPVLRDLFGNRSELLFQQKPMDKLLFIENLQKQGKHVAMIGDGLNDAGALQQSNVGITLADDINNFTPSCDAILNAEKFRKLPELLKLAKASKYIINSSFVVSILYNLVGLWFAMQGILNPMVAAILMPCSTISIVLITSGVSSIIAKSYGLSLKTNN